jgi:hypothetical protein
MKVTFQHFEFRHVSISTFFNFQLSNRSHISNIVIFTISFSPIGCYFNFQHFSFALYVDKSMKQGHPTMSAHLHNGEGVGASAVVLPAGESKGVKEEGDGGVGVVWKVEARM